MTAIQRIEQILAEKKIRNPEFQRRLSITSQCWNNWKRRGLPPKMIFKIAALLGINTDWIESGKGEKYSRNVCEAAEYGQMPGRCWQIPVIGNAQLGDDGYWRSMDYPPGFGDGYIIFPSKDPQAYAVRCVGDAMKPRIRNGEFLIVEPNSEAVPGDEVFITAKDSRVMVKILLYFREGRVYLHSINEKHPVLSLEMETISTIHPLARIYLLHHV